MSDKELRALMDKKREERQIRPSIFMCDFNKFKDYRELAFGNDIKQQFEKVQEEFNELSNALRNNEYKSSEEAIQETFDLIQSAFNLLPVLRANVGQYVEHNIKKDEYLRTGKYPRRKKK